MQLRPFEKEDSFADLFFFDNLGEELGSMVTLSFTSQRRWIKTSNDDIVVKSCLSHLAGPLVFCFFLSHSVVHEKQKPERETGSRSG